MIDHFNLPVRHLARSMAFYDAVLAPLGLSSFGEEDGACGYGTQTWTFGLIERHTPCPPLHIAFKADTQEMVDAFYSAAFSQGARSNGGPGLRQHYGANYYAAFVFDPDGHNIEAVCRIPLLQPL